MGNLRKKSLRSKRTFPRFDTKLLLFSGVLMVTLLLLISQVKLQQDPRSRAQEITNCTVNESDSTLDVEEKMMLEKINAYRANNGAGPLTISPNLQRAATWLSIDMNAKKYLSHTDSSKREFPGRIANCGYSGSKSAENIAQTSPEAAATLTGWSNSTPHNNNLLNSDFKAVGVARAGNFWTVDFGSDDDSNDPPVPTGLPVPSTTDPSFGVIQPCPSCSSPTTGAQPQVSEQPLDREPSEVPQPTNGTEEETIIPSPVDTKHSDPESGGLLGLLLQLIKTLLEFFVALLGR